MGCSGLGGFCLKRKMLAVREDVAERMSEIASRKGLTLYGLVNEALEWVSRMEDMGVTLDRIVEEYRTLDAAKRAGFLLCPESLWYETVEQACRNGEDRMAKRWFEAGVRFAKLYMVRESEDALAAFKRDIRNFTWNASDFSFDEGADDGQIIVRCISPKFPESYAILLCRFLEGSFDAFGYECIRRDVAKGALQLSLSRERSDAGA